MPRTKELKKGVHLSFGLVADEELSAPPPPLDSPPIQHFTWGCQSGFTLIELMIVVGIIGILVTIAAPEFGKYQNKAKQAEAKTSLAATFGLEKAFHAEYTAYIPSLDAIGYSREGFRFYYAIGWSNPYTGNVTGYGGTKSTPYLDRQNVPTDFLPCDGGGMNLSDEPPETTDNPQTFRVIAKGRLRVGSNCDVWRINQVKLLENYHIGI